MRNPNLEYRRIDLRAALASVETRAVEGAGDGKVRGYAIVWNSDSVDMGFIERIAPGATDRTLRDARDNDWNITFQWEHDVYSAGSVPLGSTRSGLLTFTVDDHGLAFVLDPKRLSDAQYDAIRSGDMQMSFGMVVDQQTVAKTGDTVIRTIEELTLFEISAVQSPAYPASEVGVRAEPDWLKEARAMTPAAEPDAVEDPDQDGDDDAPEINIEINVNANNVVVNVGTTTEPDEDDQLAARRSKNVEYIDKRLKALSARR